MQPTAAVSASNRQKALIKRYGAERRTGEMDRRGKEGVSLEYLVRRAKRGDPQAFIELIEAGRQSMYKVARSYFSNEEDIADVIQDTVETAYRSIAGLKNDKYFHTWLIRILINKCIDMIRKNRRESPVGFLPEQGEMCAELANCEFEELMRFLDEKYRTVLLLYYGEGIKVTEIAQILDMEENTVKSRLSRGREKFRKIWTAQNAATE